MLGCARPSSLQGVLLHDRAVGGDDREHGLASAVGRRAEEGGSDRALAQCTRCDLSGGVDLIAIGQIADINATDRWVGCAFERQAGRVENARRARPVQAERRIGGQMRPKALLLDRPRGLLTPV